MLFDKVLIANRGEIAVRICRSLRELGIDSVAIYSEADEDALHVDLADEAYCIGPASANKSYLDIPSIMSVAEIIEADAIHPGYGFLSENAYFAEVCESTGIKFIGPNSDTIAMMGDKSQARQTMKEAGVPVVPGLKDGFDNIDDAYEFAEDAGYPVIVKASAGGGGKGMRIVESADDLENAIQTARSEADAAFGDERVYIEKFLKNPKHIEFQILADTHGNTIHLGERDCSIQRRHQKMIEEAPSPVLDPELREEMGEVAVKAAQAVDYTNAGTVEFLLDDENNYFFMEMNARLQVEHPITEFVTGVDIVKEQIKIAYGKELSYTQKDIQIKGAAIECRINAEDPANDFMPSPGNINNYIIPGGFGIRIDSGVFTGASITPHYDPLVAKLIAWEQTREETIQKMKRALYEFKVGGIKTTIPFYMGIFNNSVFKEGKYSTNFINEYLEKESGKNK